MEYLLIAILALAFISGAPLFTIMLAGAALGAMLSTRGFDVDFNGAIDKLFGTHLRDEMEVLSTIPMFIYAGYLLAEARMADRLVRFANALLGWLPGGLAIVTIGTCALFTVFTGASGVTIIALGGVLMPALVKNGYPKKFSMGLIAGTGSVGLLFPPALPLFVYGTIYGLQQLDKDWDTRRFMFAGVVPGLIVLAMLSAVALVVAITRKLPRQRFSAAELARSIGPALPELLIPFGVIAGMATGFALPEIAALTVVYVIVLELGIYRALKPAQMWGIATEASAMIGAIFMIILASTALTDVLVTGQVTQKMVGWTQDHVESKVVFLIALNVLLLIVGTMMDIFSAIVIVLPLIAPIARAYGIDPYHLGVIFLLNLEIGYLHPPVGLNLFLTSVKFRRPITEVMWATVPFLVTMLIALVIISYVPALTVVPEAERTAPVRNLVKLVENGIEESEVSIAKITLVDAAGKQLADDAGKPVVRLFVDCKAIEEENARRRCQKLFFDVATCRPDPALQIPDQLECANKAIAAWTVDNMNGDELHPEYALITVREIALVDGDGKPLEFDAPVRDAAGRPVLEPTGAPKTEMRAAADQDGKPIVKKLAACSKLTGTQRETCRAIFVKASNCTILPEDPSDCIEEHTADCPEDTKDACVKERSDKCVADLRGECIREAATEWLTDNPDKALE
ncbi:MAG: TRAP transporter large permease [Kofleriaceae bacterium]